MRAVDEVGPPRLVFGPGTEGRTAAVLEELGARRVLLVATARHRDGADRLAAALGDRAVGVWTGAMPQVPQETADALAAEVRRTGADWVVAHGGGTAIGAAKGAALQTGVAIAAVPTTYSGSEMTSIWGISRDGVKTTGRDPAVRPRLVVHDPALLAPLRPAVRDASLLNALAHSVDALFDPEATALHDDAEESVRALVGALRSFADGAASDDAVAEALRGAMLAGRVLDGARMALHHKLAHVLGGSFGTPHAETHAALLPYTLAFNVLASPEAGRRLRRAFGAKDVAADLFDLASSLGVAVRLGALGFSADRIEEAVALALQASYPNPREVTGDGLRDLLGDAVLGRRPSTRTRRLALPDVAGPHAGLAASRQGPTLAAAQGVVIAVHGRGSTADAFLARVRPLVPAGVAVLAPQAAANSWYPRGFRDREANAEHLASALSVLDATFEAVTAHVPPRRVVLVGFSQGACLALTWLAHRRDRSRPGAVCAWTGAAIPGFDTYGDLAGLPAHLGTAERDPWVALDDVQRTAGALRAAGADLTVQIAPSSTHAIRPPDEVALRTFLETLVTGDDLTYQTGFGNALASEARPGALPPLQNGPRKVPYGLYAEQINGTGFTVHRAQNHRVWMYRLRPQIAEVPWEQIPSGRFVGRFDEGSVSPNLLRFAPMPYPADDRDFLDGLSTFAGAGDPATKAGFAIHVYAATRDMERAFTSVDGDLLVVPEDGALRVQTELGWLHARPGEILVLPRGIRFRVLLPDGRARGFVGELFNGHYQLPERGPIGANGLADERHFKAPVAAFEDAPGPYEVVHKQGGDLWRTSLPGSPFDVVAWHGTYAPFKYDLMDFNAYWGANWDHPDPSILTVLTSPHDDHGRNAVDFAVFKGRWDTIEHSFRPPFLHRNSAIEFNAVLKTPSVSGPYVAGASTWTPYLSPHGVSRRGYERAISGPDEAADAPKRLPDDELWIQFESTYQLRVMPWFTDAAHRDPGYLDQFAGFVPAQVD
jgi:homogentisate 1,2-dioxygenase